MSVYYLMKCCTNVYIYSIEMMFTNRFTKDKFNVINFFSVYDNGKIKAEILLRDFFASKQSGSKNLALQISKVTAQVH